MLFSIALNPQKEWVVVVRGVCNETLSPKWVLTKSQNGILLLNTLALNPQEGWIVVGRGVYNETPESDLNFKKNLYLHLVNFIRFV